MGGSAKLKDLYTSLLVYFPEITHDDLQVTVKRGKGTQPKWNNEVRQSRRPLVRDGLIDGSAWGIWQITAKGRATIGAPPGPDTQPTPALRHEQLIQMGRELGEMLGQVVETETGPVHKHDIWWKANIWANPRLVIEICDEGNLDKDIQSLNWANQNWKAKGILVIVDDKERSKVARRLAGVPVLTLRAEDRASLHSVAKSAGPDVLKLIFGA